jgi:hypothetical protein
MVDHFENYPLPEGISDALWKNLTFLYSANLYIGIYGTETQRRLANTPFFTEVTKYFD